MLWLQELETFDIFFSFVLAIKTSRTGAEVRSFEIIQQDVKAVGDFDRDTVILLSQLSMSMLVLSADVHMGHTYFGPLPVYGKQVMK